jgi:hypothetical protein
MSITSEELKRLLTYNHNSGEFNWKSRTDVSKSWNSRYAGRSAGTECNGYVKISINKKIYYAHRLAYLFMEGVEPDGEIDHIDGDRKNNRYENLRLVTSMENKRNMSTPRNNSSGTMGVRYRKDKNKWLAYISINNKSVHLGYFTSRELACSARLKAEKENGFHQNHGRKAA